MAEEQTSDTLPRVKAVAAGRAPFMLDIAWADGGKDCVDLTGLVCRSRVFRIFLDEPAAFRKIRVANFGGGIEWENGLDYGANTLRTPAEEQRPLSGADL